MKEKSQVNKKPSIKICHLADIHLGFRRYQKTTKQGYNQREVDVNQSFREVIDRILDLQPDLVIIAGDLFHAVRPSNAVITFCFQQLRRLIQNSSAELVMIAGNHESPRRSDSGSILRLFKELDRTYVADNEIKVFDVCNQKVQVTCLPHLAVQNEVWQLPQQSNQASYQVLVAHAQVDERLVGEYGAVRINFSQLKPNMWDYIALGHVHRFIELSYNAAYAGAIEHTSGNAWQDAEQPKGLIELQLPERKLIFHQLKTIRELITLTSINATELTAQELMAEINNRVRKIAGGIEGKIVRLQILGIQRAVLKSLDYQELRRIKSPALHFQIDFKVDDPSLTSVSATNGRVTLRDELQRYFSENFITAETDSDQIQNCLLKYLDKVEQYSEANQT